MNIIPVNINDFLNRIRSMSSASSSAAVQKPQKVQKVSDVGNTSSEVFKSSEDLRTYKEIRDAQYSTPKYPQKNIKG